jgi:hypothetical protein
MSIPREVMNDLLTLYLAGEASPETRRLVEDFARNHPDFAQSMATARQLELPPAEPEARPREKSELTTLRLVRQYIFLRSLFFGTGLAFTMMAFTFVFHNGNITFFLLRDEPGLGYSALSLAAASWSAWYVMYRQVRKAGL